MFVLFSAVILDLLLGDPTSYPHPVVLMGKLISSFDNILRNNLEDNRKQRFKGFVLVLLVLSITFLITYFTISLFTYLNNYLSTALKIFILYTTIAIKGLSAAGRKIYKSLQEDNKQKACSSLNMFVGRETDKLNEDEIIRATVETIAENTSDGIIAPLFYYLIGGPVAAVLYKAVNTMDSMLGYKNQKYRYFGWTAAKLDDVVNYIPARLTALFIIIAAVLLQKDYKRAYKTILNDADKHVSPNAGYPESAVAGALKIQLGGVNYYFGRVSKKALLGEKILDFSNKNIKETISLMYIASFSFILMSVFLLYIFR